MRPELSRTLESAILIMMKSKRSSTVPTVVAMMLSVFLITLVGCSSTQTMRTQLNRVTKDWALTMRASQVLPVYPPTEDLQPGDVFVVQSSFKNQVQVFDDRGFLPLDKQITRLETPAFDRFYERTYGMPEGTKAAGSNVWTTPINEINLADHAPRVAFPSYSFELERGGGLSVALPVQSVPIGLGLLQTDSAYGSITIKEAFTYGLSEELMLNSVIDWAAAHPNLLALYAPTNSQTNYLRVVNRVFVASEVNVFLTRSDAAPKSSDDGPNLFSLGESNAVEVYSSTLDALSKVANRSEVGSGSLKLTSATSRSLNLQERFRRPLVIGFLSMDFPILQEGGLGAPFSTYSALTQEGIMPSNTQVFTYDTQDENAVKIMAWLVQTDADGNAMNQERLAEWLLKNRYHKQAMREVPFVTWSPEYREMRRQIVDELIEP